MRRRIFSSIAVIVLVSLALAQKTQDNPNRLNQLHELTVAELKIGKKPLKAWVMDNNSKRQEGMMFLTEKETPLDKGMIFVFKDSAPRSFWNHNVPIDLDIAYIDANGKVIRVTILKKQDPASVPSNGDAKYVLEMRKGGFKPFEIKVGTKIEGLTKLKAIE
ncbi:MAG: DUF192 domain-containing protein [Fimbriimonadaceae bacterium]|nr:DUF192 domain-containing protein [Fimbriimonadaceae bacterium]